MYHVFEFIKMLVEILVGAIPSIAGARKQKKAATLGTELFLVYVQINEALWLGDQITDALETYVEGVRGAGGDTKAVGEFAKNIAARLEDDLSRQAYGLDVICSKMWQFGVHLQIIQGESFNKLESLLTSKDSALVILHDWLEYGGLPTRVTDRDIQEMAKLPIGTPGGEREGIGEIADRMTDGILDVHDPWGDVEYALIVAYLESRKPREQLAHIRAALSELHDALVQHFSIEDVLLAVQHHRVSVDLVPDWSE